MINAKDYGAIGDGKADDTLALKNALIACGRQHQLYLPQGEYMTTETLEVGCRGITGDARWVDSGAMGTAITFRPIDKTTDLLPAIRVGGYASQFENFTVFGDTGYSLLNIAKYVNRALFDQQQYSMFAPGRAAIEVVGGGTPTFRNVGTKGTKVGLLLNNNVGHITSYDSDWGGLIGIYCKKNNYDYSFFRGNITGVFCGILCGVGGFAACIYHTHTGFAPYGIFQVWDDPNFKGIPKGLGGHFHYLQFEMCGEAAIKMLDSAQMGPLYMNGWGFSWSNYNNGGQGGWLFSFPDSFMALGERQKYAAYLGMMNPDITIDRMSTMISKSGAPGAVGSAYIDTLAGDNHHLQGLNLPQTVIKRKVSPSRISSDVEKSLDERQYRSLNPVAPPNLLKNVNDVANYRIEGGASLTAVTDLTTLPSQLTNEMKAILGKNPVIWKLTPDGVNKPQLKINFHAGIPAKLHPDRYLAVSLFVITPAGFLARISIPRENGGGYLFNDIIGGSGDAWKRVVNREHKSPAGVYQELSMGPFSANIPTYFAGLMVSYEDATAFSPYPHHFVDSSLELGDALYLTDKITGIRKKITLENGVIAINPATP